MRADDGGQGDWGTLALGILAGVAVIALLVAAYAIGATKGRADAEREPTGAATVASEEPSPAVDAAAVASFTSACGGCHALAAAGTTASIGPDLDALAPTVEQVLAAIANGGAGTGQMPAGLLTGAEAEAVAELVAR